MARGAWDHTAALLAAMANLVRDQGERPSPYAPADFHPLRASPTEAAEIIPYDPTLMEAMQKGRLYG